MSTLQKLGARSLITVGLLTMIGCAVEPELPAISEITGNGAPSGAHYNLNIIGVPKTKTSDMTGNQGRRIFVPETGSAKIN